METLKEAVRLAIKALETKRLGVASGDEPERVLKKILSKEELSHVQFHYLKKGILHLKVESSVWLYHLNLRKEKMLERLRQECTAVKDLRLSIGEINKK